MVHFYETLAASIARSLSNVTEDGFVFRVDLRLRPEGEKGELVPSISNAVDYYLGWGRTWERAVLMKAVPLAGDIALGNAFVDELEPFIYRKHLDYSTLEEIRMMKLRTEAKIKRKPGLNIKLGQGGIRGIEFFVQTLQLINAGRIRRVRSASTLKALELLSETGLLDEKTSVGLAEAYLFFRKTEHRIQINHQVQTHELPRTPEDQAELARRMGYRGESLNLFLSDLEKHRHYVEELFSGMFYHGDQELNERISPASRRILDEIVDEPKALDLLIDAGFEDPASSLALIRGLALPSDKHEASSKSQVLLQRLAPLFVEELLHVPEPSKALASLAAYIDSIHASASYLSTFLENPPTVSFLIKILGESRFFTDLLIRHPQAIDSLIARGSQEQIKNKELWAAELVERLAYCDNYEEELDILRRFKNEEMLLIGVRHLFGDIDSPAARKSFSQLAEICIDAATDTALRAMRKKFGDTNLPEPLPFVVLGMGKLGGREMTYLSDLDVIFIYDFSQEEIANFSSHEWFTRLASRIISALSVPTSEGTVFSIDTRLRPSGNKGPLVSSLQSFTSYHESSSKIWEKQALLKARPVSGPSGLIDAVDQIVRNCIFSTKFSDTDIEEIARLRSRMETELALEDREHVDLKTGHGGLVDVEFFVQGNILKFVGDHPRILKSGTLDALAALRLENLVTEDQFRILDSGYRFLTNLEDRFRIMEHRSIDRIPLKGEKLRGLAARLGYSKGEEQLFLEDYFMTTQEIRSIYNSFFLKEKSSVKGSV